MVHVRSQERHRHSVSVVMAFASVPMIRPLQKGQVVGRSTATPSRRSNIVFSVLASECGDHAVISRTSGRREAATHNHTGISMTAIAMGSRTLCRSRPGNGEPIARHRPTRHAAAARVVARHRREEGQGPRRRTAPRTRVAVTGTRPCGIAGGRDIHRIASWMLSDVVCAGRFQ